MQSITFEISWNSMDLEKKGLWNSEWWFDLGISVGSSSYHQYKRVMTIGLGLFSIYIRW